MHIATEEVIGLLAIVKMGSFPPNVEEGGNLKRTGKTKAIQGDGFVHFGHIWMILFDFVGYSEELIGVLLSLTVPRQRITCPLIHHSVASMA